MIQGVEGEPIPRMGGNVADCAIGLGRSAAREAIGIDSNPPNPATPDNGEDAFAKLLAAEKQFNTEVAAGTQDIGDVMKQFEAATARSVPKPDRQLPVAPLDKVPSPVDKAPKAKLAATNPLPATTKSTAVPNTVTVVPVELRADAQMLANGVDNRAPIVAPSSSERVTDKSRQPSTRPDKAPASPPPKSVNLAKLSPTDSPPSPGFRRASLLRPITHEAPDTAADAQQLNPAAGAGDRQEPVVFVNSELPEVPTMILSDTEVNDDHSKVTETFDVATAEVDDGYDIQSIVDPEVDPPTDIEDQQVLTAEISERVAMDELIVEIEELFEQSEFGEQTDNMIGNDVTELVLIEDIVTDDSLDRETDTPIQSHLFERQLITQMAGFYDREASATEGHMQPELRFAEIIVTPDSQKPVPETMSKVIVTLIQMTPDQIDSDPLATAINHKVMALAASWQEATDRYRSGEVSRPVTAEVINGLADLLAALGYENPTEAIRSLVNDQGLSYLLTMLEYLGRLQNMDNRQELLLGLQSSHHIKHAQIPRRVGRTVLTFILSLARQFDNEMQGDAA